MQRRQRRLVGLPHVLGELQRPVQRGVATAHDHQVLAGEVLRAPDPVEQLAAVGMALHDLDPDRHGPRLRDEETDIGGAAVMGDIDLCEPVAAHGIALIDGDVAGAFRLDDLTEGRKGVLRELFNLEFHVASTLARLCADPT